MHQVMVWFRFGRRTISDEDLENKRIECEKILGAHWDLWNWYSNYEADWKDELQTIFKLNVYFSFFRGRIKELKTEAQELKIGLNDHIENKITECEKILGARWLSIEYQSRQGEVVYRKEKSWEIEDDPEEYMKMLDEMDDLPKLTQMTQQDPNLAWSSGDSLFKTTFKMIGLGLTMPIWLPLILFWKGKTEDEPATEKSKSIKKKKKKTNK